MLRKILLLGFLWPALVFSQDEIILDISPSKISTDVKMIVPFGQVYLFERYHYFKYNYWVSKIDTLKKLENGMLQGNGIQIKPETFTKRCNKCDTIINKIRNSSLNDKLFSELRKLAREEIGYDSKEFIKGQYNGRPSAENEKMVCHEEFKEMDLKWFSQQTERIKEIKEKKKERQQWIKNNKEKIDKEFIKTFLQDYGSCEIDQVAMIDIIQNKTDDFLIVCKDLKDLDFYEVKLKISLLPDHISATEAIKSLKNSGVKTSRKRKLIRKLMKNTV